MKDNRRYFENIVEDVKDAGIENGHTYKTSFGKELSTAIREQQKSRDNELNDQ